MKTQTILIILVVALAVVLGIMNYRSYQRKKNAVTRTQNGGAAGAYPTTKPPIDMGGTNGIGGEMEQMPTAYLPSAEMEAMFGDGAEDFANGIAEPAPVHTGVSMPAEFYAN